MVLTSIQFCSALLVVRCCNKSHSLAECIKRADPDPEVMFSPVSAMAGFRFLKASVNNIGTRCDDKFYCINSSSSNDVRHLL